MKFKNDLTECHSFRHKYQTEGHLQPNEAEPLLRTYIPFLSHVCKDVSQLVSCDFVCMLIYTEVYTGVLTERP